MEAIRVLLADDHALFREGLASLLRAESGFEVVGQVQNGQEAIEKAKELMPDIILMDVYMPVLTGIEATRQIKENLPYVKIVMLSASEEEQVLFEAIKSGAQGYLLKEIDVKELFEMLHGVVRGEAPISRSTAGKILGELVRQSHREPEDGSSPEKLSPREREVLEHLTEGATNKQIAVTLGISENTVKNHLKNILEKLHLRNRVEAVTYAFREGLIHQRKS